jgi:hypothetical protein
MTEQDKYNLGRITGAKQMIGGFNIPAKCKLCGKTIFLPTMPPEGFISICVNCAIKEINQSSEFHPDITKDMVLAGYMQMQKAGF